MLYVRDQLSEAAQLVYDEMVLAMDQKGYLNWEACLALSVDGLVLAEGPEGLKSALAELQREHLAFPHPDSSGWVVRLPLRACEPPAELP